MIVSYFRDKGTVIKLQNVLHYIIIIKIICVIKKWQERHLVIYSLNGYGKHHYFRFLGFGLGFRVGWV